MTKVILSIETKKRIRLALFCYFFCVGLCFSSWASRIPEIKSALGLDDAAWGTMLLMAPIGQIIGMTFSGRLIARVGSNRVLITAAIGYALSLTMIGLSSTLLPFIVALIFFGFFGNFCNIAMNSQALLVEDVYSKPIMSSFHGGWSMAGLCGGLIGLAMTLIGVSAKAHFIAISSIVTFTAIYLYRFLQFDASQKSDTSDEDKQKAKIPFEMFLLWFGIIGFFGWTTEGTMTDWNGIYLRDIVGVEERITPIGLTLYMVTMTVGRFLMDRATAKWGRKVVLSFCSAAILFGMMLFVLVPTFIVTLIGYMIVGLGACGVIPLLYSATGEKTKMHPGRAITIVSSISFAGFLIGPPIIGYISQLTNLRYAFALVAFFGLCSWIMSARSNSLD